MLKSFQARLGLLLAFASVLVAAAPAAAAPGDLDPSFGSGGTRDIPSSSMAVQPDGKLVVVKGDGVRRYNADGTLDTSFAGFTHRDRVGFNGVAIQPDGKIVAVGTDLSGSAGVAVRLNGDGSFDNTFGWRWWKPGGLSASAFDVAIAPDGGVLVSGEYGDDCEFSTCWPSAYVTRLTSSGEADAAFGQNGVATVDAAAGKSVETAAALDVQSDGKIVLAGHFSDFTAGDAGLVARLDSGGTLDPSFGSGGITTVEFADGGTHLTDVEVDTADRINVAGEGDNSTTGPRQLVAGRLLGDGSGDPGFGNGGWYVTGFTYGGDARGAGDGTTLAIDGSGRVLFSGAMNLGPTSGAGEDIAVVRLGTDGQPDSTFGNGGVALHSLGAEHEEIRTMARQPDGRILVGTSQQNFNGTEVAAPMARILTGDEPAPPPDPSASVSGTTIAEGDSGTSTATFTVTLSDAHAGCDVTVDYATQDGSATAGSDYVPTSGTLTIPAGSTSGTIGVTVNGDGTPEPDEMFSLTLSNPTCATLGTASADATIENDDFAPQIVGQSPAPAATGVPADTLVSVTFDRPVTSWSLVLTDDRGRGVRGALSCNSPCTTVTFDPKRLAPGDTYSVSASGSNGAGGDSASWSFTTAPRR